MDHTLLKAMFVEANIGILIVNKAGGIVSANPYSEQLFGYDEDELLTKKIEDLLPNALRTRHVKHREGYFKKPVARSMGANLNLSAQRKDGSHFPVEISLSYVRNNDELFSIAYINDDTIRKNILNESLESKQQLEEAQHLAHLGSFEVNLKTGEENWSKEMFHIFELDVEKRAIKHEEFFSFVHPDDRDFVDKAHQQMIKEKKGINFGYRIITKKGNLKYLEGKRKVKLDEQGHVLSIAGSIQDVTELIEAKNNSEYISNIVEQSLNEIYIFHAETLKFIRVNKGARQNVGYSMEEMKKLTPIDIKPEYDKASFVKIVEPLKKGLTDKLLFETIHQRKDKTTYPVEIHLQYSKIGHEDVFVAFILDISERKAYEQKLLVYSDQLEQKIEERTKKLIKSEAELRKALEKEKELGELKSRFVSMASHEFRTPLTSVLSSASLISRYEKEDQQDKRMKHIKRIESSVKNLNSILNDFLSLEKLESGKVRFEPIELHFTDYIQQIIDEVNLTAKENQEIIFHHVGKEKIAIDEHLLKNVLINLLSNAIKYSPSGSNVELLSTNEKDSLIIQVKDYGIGIPEDEQKHLFTRFFRATNATNIKGTGLGLTIIKRYLDLMEAGINFQSVYEEGSTFTIVIPHPKNS